jgi:hypothetical protein
VSDAPEAPAPEVEEDRPAYLRTILAGAESLTLEQLLPLVMQAVGPVGKGGYNTQQNFAFRGIDDVLRAVQPALIDLGVVMRPKRMKLLADERYQSRGGGYMRSVTLEVTYAVTGPAGDSLELQVLGEAADAGDKGVSKAESQAYKYAWNELLAIPTDEERRNDPDSQAHERGAPWLMELTNRIRTLPEDARVKLSDYGQKAGIRRDWSGAGDDWQVRLEELVDRAEAKVREDAAQEAAEAGVAAEAKSEGDKPAEGAPAPETTPTEQSERTEGDPAERFTPEQRAELEKIEKALDEARARQEAEAEEKAEAERAEAARLEHEELMAQDPAQPHTFVDAGAGQPCELCGEQYLHELHPESTQGEGRVFGQVPTEAELPSPEEQADDEQMKAEGE